MSGGGFHGHASPAPSLRTQYSTEKETVMDKASINSMRILACCECGIELACEEAVSDGVSE